MLQWFKLMMIIMKILDENTFKKILLDLKSNKPISKGSQIGRQTSHPQRGKDA